MILWGLPFLQYLMRPEMTDANQEQLRQTRFDAIVTQLTKEIAHSVSDGGCASVDPCSICFEEFKTGHVLREINHCKHKFHRACIDEWIRRKSPADGFPNCPLCKHELKPKELPLNGNHENETNPNHIVLV